MTGRRATFWVSAGALAVVLLGSTAPSPLYAVYQQQWHFSSALLTVVFAVYAASLLGALLTFGRLSDHLGRRPVIVGGLVVTIAAMATFLVARDADALLAARFLQGIGAGTVTSAAGSALLDVEVPGSGHGALTSTVVPGAAMAVGSLGAAALVQYGPYPTHLIWIVLIVLLLAAVAGVSSTGGSGAQRPGALRSLRPSITVEVESRRAFRAAVPGFVAVWALSAFYLALGPKLTALVSGSGDVLTDTLIVALLTGVGSAASVPLRPASPAHLSGIGLGLLFFGTAGALVAVLTSLPAVLFIGSGIAGAGWGIAYLGLYRTLIALAGPHARGGMVSSIYVVAYLAVALPSVAAGVSTSAYGLVPTATVFLALVLLVTANALIGLRNAVVVSDAS